MYYYFTLLFEYVQRITKQKTRKTRKNKITKKKLKIFSCRKKKEKTKKSKSEKKCWRRKNIENVCGKKTEEFCCHFVGGISSPPKKAKM